MYKLEMCNLDDCLMIFIESIRRGNGCYRRHLFLGVQSPGKIFDSPGRFYVFLQSFYKSSPENFDLFLWCFFLLKNLMCSFKIWRNIFLVRSVSWKNSIFVLLLLENSMCSYREFMSKNIGSWICLFTSKSPLKKLHVFCWLPVLF